MGVPSVCPRSWRVVLQSGCPRRPPKREARSSSGAGSSGDALENLKLMPSAQPAWVGLSPAPRLAGFREGHPVSAAQRESEKFEKCFVKRTRMKSYGNRGKAGYRKRRLKLSPSPESTSRAGASPCRSAANQAGKVFPSLLHGQKKEGKEVRNLQGMGGLLEGSRARDSAQAGPRSAAVPAGVGPPGGAGAQPDGSFPIGLLRNLWIPHVRLQLSQQELSGCGRGSKTGFNKCLTLLG